MEVKKKSEFCSSRAGGLHSVGRIHRSWAAQGPLRPIMLESMFDDDVTMDKRQFLYQV